MTFVAKSARSLYVDVTKITKIALSETLITAYLTSAIVPIIRPETHYFTEVCKIEERPNYRKTSFLQACDVADPTPLLPSRSIPPFDMSFKSKDLAYDAKEPAFLRRIRGRQAGTGVDSDRHERPIARPRGAARATNDDDDAPTYVVEDSNTTLSKEEYEALLKEEQGPSGEAEKNGSVEDKFAESSGVAARQESGTGEVAAVVEEEAKMRTKQEVTEVGGQQKKRKAARVVGIAGDEETNGAEEDEGEPKRVKQVKRKIKPVKLSFDGE
jgi:hypothetical protein